MTRWFRAPGSGFRVSGFGARREKTKEGPPGFRNPGSGFRDPNFGCGFRVRISGTNLGYLGLLGVGEGLDLAGRGVALVAQLHHHLGRALRVDLGYVTKSAPKVDCVRAS